MEIKMTNDVMIECYNAALKDFDTQRTCDHCGNTKVECKRMSGVEGGGPEGEHEVDVTWACFGCYQEIMSVFPEHDNLRSFKPEYVFNALDNHWYKVTKLFNKSFPSIPTYEVTREE